MHFCRIFGSVDLRVLLPRPAPLEKAPPRTSLANTTCRKVPTRTRRRFPLGPTSPDVVVIASAVPNSCIDYRFPMDAGLIIYLSPANSIDILLETKLHWVQDSTGWWQTCDQTAWQRSPTLIARSNEAAESSASFNWDCLLLGWHQYTIAGR